ncbi:MAG: hypothetical protein U0411_10945 [Thermodesulfovibrionales bacterium]
MALVLSDRIGWQNTYLLMAVLMTIGVLSALLGPEPETVASSRQSPGGGGLKDFFSRRSAVVFLLLIVLYKLGDAYAGTMTTAFLIRGWVLLPRMWARSTRDWGSSWLPGRCSGEG